MIRLLIPGMFFSNFNLSTTYLVFKRNPLVSILFTWLTNFLYSVFLITPFFTTLDNLLKSTGTIFSLSVSNISTSVFKLAKFVFNENSKCSHEQHF